MNNPSLSNITIPIESINYIKEAFKARQNPVKDSSNDVRILDKHVKPKVFKSFTCNKIGSKINHKAPLETLKINHNVDTEIFDPITRENYNFIKEKIANIMKSFKKRRVFLVNRNDDSIVDVSLYELRKKEIKEGLRKSKELKGDFRKFKMLNGYTKVLFLPEYIPNSKI